MSRKYIFILLLVPSSAGALSAGQFPNANITKGVSDSSSIAGHTATFEPTGGHPCVEPQELIGRRYSYNQKIAKPGDVFALGGVQYVVVKMLFVDLLNGDVYSLIYPKVKGNSHLSELV